MDDTIRLKTKQMAFVQNFFDKNVIKTAIGYVLPLFNINATMQAYQTGKH